MRWLTLPRLVVALTFIAIFAMAARVSVDTDTWWHLRTGQWIVEHRAIPQVDVFSTTRAGADWRIPGWLAQAPLYLVFAAFGYGGLNLLTAALITLTFALVYPMCAGHPLLRAFALVLAAAVSGLYWSARPQLVSLVLAAAFALILYQYRWQQRNRLWLLPILMVVWANAHGGFAIGFILLAVTVAGEGAHWLWERWRQRRSQRARPLLWLLGITALCALAVMLNPAGPALVLYPFKTVGIGALRDFIQEWQSPDFHALEAQPFLWLLFLTLSVVALSGRRPDFTDLCLVLTTAYLGFLAGRNLPLLAVAAPPLLTRHAAFLLDDWRAARGEAAPAAPFAGNTVLNWALLIGLGLAALLKVITVLPASINEPALARFTPMAAVDFIRGERPAGPLFNSYNFGGYLVWALYPDYPVYVDGRTDLYDDAFLREYLQVALGRPGYQAVLDRAGIRLVLVEADSLLGDRLAADPAWRLAYHDAVAAVYERTP